MEDEFFVGAVVRSGAFGGDVVGGFEGDRVLSLDAEDAGGSGAATAADGADKKPDNFVNETVDADVDLVPDAAELALGEEAQGAEEVGH